MPPSCHLSACLHTCVYRRVMATLGELLFYVATQQQDSGAATVAGASEAWGITQETVAAVVHLLRPNEDEVCQHYAIKTIENICSQGGEWAGKFAQQVGASCPISASTTQLVNAIPDNIMRSRFLSAVACVCVMPPQFIKKQRYAQTLICVDLALGLHTVFAAGCMFPSLIPQN